MEPGTLVAVDLTSDPPATYFPTGDQVDCSDPDPQPFESYFEPWVDQTVTIIYDGTLDVAAIQPNDEDDPVFEFAVEPGIIELLGGIDFTDAFFAEEESTPVTESSFEPWTDLSAVTIIWDGSTDYDTAQPPNDEDPPEQEYAFSVYIAIDVDLFDVALEFPTGDQLSDESDPDTFAYAFDADGTITVVAITESVTAFFIF
jgi:hypothetical protein